MPVMEDLERSDARFGVRDSAWLAEQLTASIVAELDPDAVGLSDAVGLWVSFDRVERLAANAKVLLAARVEDSGEWKWAGFRSAAAHLAQLAGVSVGVARRALTNSKELPELTAVADAMRAGLLSGEQVDAIVPAAAADPDASDRLVGVAQVTNVSELRAECLRTKAAADPDADATHSRIRRGRFVRTATDAEGAWTLRARGTADDGARFERVLAPIIAEMFERARVEDYYESRDAYAFDALMHLANRDLTDTATTTPAKMREPNPRFLSLLHIPFEALTRGAVDGEEMCEIVGIGPVPVRVARELLGESILKLVITKGVDVANVTHVGRGPTAAQSVALLWSKPKCANQACSSMFVEIDHRDPWAKTHHTKLRELDPLCPHDHDLKTNQGWLLVEGKGRRAFVSPKDPRHPRHKPPP